jgi:hypothetical protein
MATTVANQNGTPTGSGAPPPTAGDSPPPPAAGVPSNTLATWITALMVVALLIGILLQVYLAVQGTSDLTWTRVVYALAPIETIAFAAAGWLFGREVHREQAQQAEQRATNAEENAQTAQKEAIASKTEAEHEKVRGQVLAQANLQKALPKAVVAARATGEFQKIAGGPDEEPIDSSVAELASLAKMLYPEVTA